MKYKTGLILLLALLIGTCTAFAKGEIERYQRDKRIELAVHLEREVAWLNTLMWRQEGPFLLVSRDCLRTVADLTLVIRCAGVPQLFARRDNAHLGAVRAAERALCVAGQQLSGGMQVEAAKGVKWRWGEKVDGYNEELKRQNEFEEQLGRSRGDARDARGGPLGGSLGKLKWRMQYDDVVEWFELTEDDIITILRRWQHLDEVRVVNLEGRVYARIWGELINLLHARNDIEIIDLSRCGLSEEVAGELIHVLEDNHVVHRIDVSGNDLSAEVITAFQAIVDRNIHNNIPITFAHVGLPPYTQISMDRSALVGPEITENGHIAYYATGEIERYQRDKLNKLAKPLWDVLTRLVATRGEKRFGLVMQEFGVPAGETTVDAQRKWWIRVHKMAGLWQRDLHKGTRLRDIPHWDWGDEALAYNKECYRQVEYANQLEAMHGRGCELMVGLPNNSLGEFKWKMQYDDVVEWFELTEDEIIEILQRIHHLYEVRVVNLAGRVYTRIWSELINLLHARNDIGVIDLSRCGLTEEVSEQLIHALENNHVVQRIDVSGNDLSAEVIAAFQAIVERNIHDNFLISLDRMELAPDTSIDVLRAAVINPDVTENGLIAVTQHANVDAELLIMIIRHPDASTGTLLAVARNKITDLVGLNSVFRNPNVTSVVLAAVAEHANADASSLRAIAGHREADPNALFFVARNLVTDAEGLIAVVHNPNANAIVLAAVAAHPNADAMVLDVVAVHPNADGALLRDIVGRPDLDAAMLATLVANPNIDIPTLLVAVQNPVTDLKGLNIVVHNPNANAQVLAAVAVCRNADAAILLEIARNRATNQIGLNAVINNPNADFQVLATIANRANVTSDLLREIARRPDLDAAMLATLAANPNIDAPTLLVVVQNPAIDLAGLQSCAVHPLVTADILAAIATHPNADVDLLRYIVTHPDTDAATLLTVVQNPITDLRGLNIVVHNPNANAQVLAAAATRRNANAATLLEIVRNRTTNMNGLNAVVNNPNADFQVLATIANRANVTSDLLREIARRPDLDAAMLATLAANPNIDANVLLAGAQSPALNLAELQDIILQPEVISSILAGVAANPNADAELLRDIVAHPNADAATLLAVAHNPIANLNANAQVLIAVANHANIDAVLLAEIKRRLQVQPDTMGNVFANLTDLNNPYSNNATNVAANANANADVTWELEGPSNTGGFVRGIPDSI